MRLVSTLVLAVGVFLACGPDPDLHQGDEYLPDGTIPLGEPSNRPRDASCDGCDGSPPDIVLPLPEGGAEPSNTCETARHMGTLSGDTVSPTLTVTGTCSEWFSLRATENDNSALGVGMRVKLTLTPVAEDFDLYAYLDPNRDVRACSAPFARSFNPGTTGETITLTWGEGSVANGGDDGRTIGIAVIKASGACGGGASYTLSATGY